MIKENVKYPEFSETDFIRLYCAMNLKKGCSPIIKHHELEKRLYSFYYIAEFRELFQDICPKKDYINPENSYLNLGMALNTAQLFGLLKPIHGVGETKSIISCDEELAQEIISKAAEEMVDKMSRLFDSMLELENNSDKTEDTQISSGKSVMNNFMERLNNDDFTYDKELPIGAELSLDKESIAEQIESYNKLLQSPITQELQGQSLVKTNKNKKN